MSLPKSFYALLLGLLLPLASYASGGGGEQEDPNGTKYVDLFPNLVTNYMKEGEKLGFLSIGMQLKTKGTVNRDLLWAHRFMLQDAAIWTVTGQNQEQVSSFEHREKLRQELMHKFTELVETELKKKDLIEDVLFSKYLWK